MVHSRNLRFDFSHFAKVTDEELQQVQDFVNARINEDLPLEERRGIPYQQAIDEGAIALFGEKYGDAVRAIKFGKSMELCGGTHVPSTSNIWHFIIIISNKIFFVINIAFGNIVHFRSSCCSMASNTICFFFTN